ncbi:MAG: hypothetical protein R3E32_11525 [Chitinophagales bacterium]
MNRFNLNFKPISDIYTEVNFEHKNIKNDKIRLRVGDSQLESIRNYSPIAADILDLATAIYTADRICKDKLKCISREIHINLPLRLPQIFQDSVIINLLDELLTWNTGSYWVFSFSKRKTQLRKAEQILSGIDFFDENSEVALWSGGLDALAGLYGRRREFPNKHFYLVGTGSNKPTIGKQKKVRNFLSKDLKDKTSLFQIPILIEGIKSLKKNFYMRSRGVVFALIGSVVAFLQKKNELFIYENGIGAFNLPYTKAGVGLYHSRSVHPITLHITSILLSHLFEKRFKV